MASDIGTTNKLGYAHYICFPDDGQRHEIIDGGHYVNPAPSTYHQTVSKKLQFQLYSQIELRGLGIVFDAPIDVQLSDFDIVQPDLVVILNSNKSIITPAKIDGTPELLVEITSPSSAVSDRQLKKELYRRAGVLEYWILDPIEHSIDQLILRNGEYHLEAPSDRVKPTMINGVEVRLSDIW
ncbi:MAG: Uma2 family endonuclease [Planctomycetota bacterium]|nr:Uma2 family endonuclease [Planctomycetota bacterium]